MDSVSWLKHALANVPTFVKGQQGSTPGFYRYSFSGDLYDEDAFWGLTSSVFGAKILYMLDSLDDQRAHDLVSRITQFESPDGTIFDPLLLKKSFFPSLLTSLKQRDIHGLLYHTQMLKRAETRQSTAALLCLGSRPSRPYRGIPETPEAIRAFLSSLSWHLPWNAGSHLSHLLFFLHHNQKLFGLYGDGQRLTDEALVFLAHIQSPTDGTWHTGTSVSTTQKINGAMKVLTGLCAIGFTNIPHVENIIDTCLSNQTEEGACCSMDALYVLHWCSRVSSYRQPDVHQYALHKIDEIKEYYHEAQGGFSFYRHRANARIYGAKVTSGKDESDLHGTVLYVWGLVMIADILQVTDLNVRQPIT